MLSASIGKERGNKEQGNGAYGLLGGVKTIRVIKGQIIAHFKAKQLGGGRFGDEGRLVGYGGVNVAVGDGSIARQRRLLDVTQLGDRRRIDPAP